MSYQPVTRAEGYAASAGKEAAAVDAARTLVADIWNQDTVPVPAGLENITRGDLCVVANGALLEVKSHAIDPTKYARCYVELGETVQNVERHWDGMGHLAALLDLRILELEGLKTKIHATGEFETFGRHPAFSVGASCLSSCNATVYVNADPERGWAYVYARSQIMPMVRRAALTLVHRGAGRANDDSFGVFIPQPPTSDRIFTRGPEGPWEPWAP